MQNSEDSLQLDDLISGWNIERDHQTSGNYNRQEESGLFSLNNFFPQENKSDYFFDTQPDQLLFFDKFLRQNSNSER